MQTGAEQSFREYSFDCARYISIKFRPHSNDREVEFLLPSWYSIPIPSVNLSMMEDYAKDYLKDNRTLVIKI